MRFKHGDKVICIQGFGKYKVGDITIIKKYIGANAHENDISLIIEGNIKNEGMIVESKTKYPPSWQNYFQLYYPIEFNNKLEKLVDE